MSVIVFGSNALRHSESFPIFLDGCVDFFGQIRIRAYVFLGGDSISDVFQLTCGDTVRFDIGSQCF